MVVVFCGVVCRRRDGAWRRKKSSQDHGRWSRVRLVSLARRVVPRGCGAMAAAAWACACALRSLAHVMIYCADTTHPPSLAPPKNNKRDAPRFKLEPTTPRPVQQQKNLYSQQTFCSLITLIGNRAIHSRLIGIGFS